jgi:hypothetical protein
MSMSAVQRIGTAVMLGCAVQLAFVLGWVSIGRQGAGPFVKLGLTGLFVVASMAVLYRLASGAGWRHLLLGCVWLALGSVLVYQLLGFTMFPGLVKDLEVFSLDHLSTSLTVFVLGFIGYLLLSFGVRLGLGLSNLLPRAKQEI